MQVIPLQAVPAQELTVNLANQATQLHVYQLSTGLFMDISVNNELIIGGVACEDRNRMVRDTYLGFIGDFIFVDLQGTDDPEYTGLGTRWFLEYLTADEAADQ